MRNGQREEITAGPAGRRRSRAELLRNATGGAALLARGGDPGVGRTLAASDALAAAAPLSTSLFHRRKLSASLNGATEVASWRRQAGPTVGGLVAAQPVPRTGFETAFEVPAGAKYGPVVGLGAHGKPPSSSTALKI